MPLTQVRPDQVVVSVSALKKALKALGPVRYPYANKLLHIGTDEGDLYLEAGSLATRARVFITSEGLADELDVVVKFEDFQKVISMADGQVIISTDGESLVIGAGRRTTTLMLSVGDDYEDSGMRPYDAGTRIATGGPEFISACVRATTHASTDETRPVLCGVQIEAGDDGHAHITATDSFRLFCGDLGEVEAGVNVVISAAVLRAALKTIDKGNGVELYDMPRHIVIDTGTTQWATPKIGGQFPNYRHLVPEGFAGRARLDRGELLKSATALSKLLMRSDPLRLRVDLEEAIVLTALADDVGSAAEAVAWEREAHLAGPVHRRLAAGVGLGETWIGINPQYFTDALKALKGATVTLEWITPTRPLRLSDEAGDWILNMPIRLGER